MPGEVFAVKTTEDGQIGNALWRKRVDDERRYGVGVIQILEMLDDTPIGVTVIDESGAALAPSEPAPRVVQPPQPPPRPSFDFDAILRRVANLESRSIPADLSDPVRRLGSTVTNHGERITALERRPAPAPVQVASSPQPGSWKALLANADDDPIADLVARIQHVEDRFEAPELPPSQRREKAIASVRSAVRDRLLDMSANEVLYQMAMLARNGNVPASLMLERVRSDVPEYAGEIIARREGTDMSRAGSEWETAVYLVIAREKWVKAIRDASDGGIQAVTGEALAEINAIGAGG